MNHRQADPAGATGGRATAVAKHVWDSTSRFRPVLVVLVVLFVYFSVSQAPFLTSRNLENLLTASSITWVAAMGMTFVILTAGFDLSVGAVAAFSGIVLAKLVGAGVPGGAAIVLTLLTGALVGGIFNGLLVGRVRLSVFVVTLATLTALTGVVNLWTQTESQFVTSPIVNDIAINSIAGVPTLIWLMAVTFIAGLYIQSRTLFGRDVYALGGSETAARLSGIRTWRVATSVYAIMGFCAALAGAIAVGRIGSASPQVDNTLALTAIAAVLIGGTSLTGGAGGVGGTALGVLFIAVLQNGLSLSGVASDWKHVVTGIILVVAMAADRFRGRWPNIIRRRARRSGAPPPGGPPHVPADAARHATS